jgi:hypothetical protein
MELSSGFFSVKSFCFTFIYLVSCLNGNELRVFAFNSLFSLILCFLSREYCGIEVLVLQFRFGYGHCASVPASVSIDCFSRVFGLYWLFLQRILLDVFVQKLVDMFGVNNSFCCALFYIILMDFYLGRGSFLKSCFVIM